MNEDTEKTADEKLREKDTAEASAEEAAEAQAEAAEEEGGDITISFAEYQELKTLARERDEYLRRLQRVVADYQNYQKRQEKMKDRIREQIKQEVVGQILPVADSLNRAMEAAEEMEGADDILEGLKLVESEFHDLLENFDVKPIEAAGEEFDPHYHDAVMQEPKENVPPNTVVRELKKGFVMGDRVIRPAQVSVSVQKPVNQG